MALSGFKSLTLGLIKLKYLIKMQHAIIMKNKLQYKKSKKVVLLKNKRVYEKYAMQMLKKQK